MAGRCTANFSRQDYLSQPLCLGTVEDGLASLGDALG